MSAPRGPGPRVRRAAAALAVPEGARVEVESALTRTPVALPAAQLAMVAGLDAWTSRALVLRRLATAGSGQPAVALGRLLAEGVLVEEGSEAARRDAAFRRTWRWGPVTAAFHRSARDLPWLSDEEAIRVLAARRGARPTLLAPARRRLVPLPPPRARAGVLPWLLRRESVREFGPASLSAAALSDVLFAGLGVRAVVRDPVQGDLPLGLAPSGGARAPLDAHVYVRRVAGLEPGAYRYERLAGGLEPTRAGARTPPSLLLGGQIWTDGAAAVIFLVASFARTSWKYRHPADYRIVLVEAGHVAQNMLLAASALGLAATPTGAFSDTAAEAALGVSGPDRALVHAVVLGPRAHGGTRFRQFSGVAAGNRELMSGALRRL